MTAQELIEAMGKMIAAYDMLTSSVETNQKGIIALTTRVTALSELCQTNKAADDEGLVEKLMEYIWAWRPTSENL